MKIFEKEEIRDLIVAIVVLTIIFSYFMSIRARLTLETIVLISLTTVIISFLFHELAHKFAAQKFGCKAQFKAWPFGLFLSLAITVITSGRFLFAAPGAVVIYPFRFGRWNYRIARLTIRESGIIAALGPLVNITFSLLFTITPIAYSDFLALINAWLAFFNLLPIPPLDGSKVIAWNPWIWIFMIVVSFLLVAPYLL